MALCGNCGAESARVRSRWTDRGIQLPDECPACAPQQFEKIKGRRDGEIVMAYEYDHKHYRMKDGIPQITDEGLQDLEDAACKQSEDEKLAYEAAVERKRHERRTQPMTPHEIESVRQRFA